MAKLGQLELTAIAARDLKKVNRSGTMNAYVIVSISGESGQKYKTPVDRSGGNNPSWNSPVAFTVDKSKPLGSTVVFDIMHKRTLRRDKKVGQVKVPLDELRNGGKYVYRVETASGEHQGHFEFLVKVSGSGWALPPPHETSDESQVISWVCAYRWHDHHRAYHRRYPSW